MSYYLFTNKTEGINIPFDCTFLKSNKSKYTENDFDINSDWQVYVSIDISNLKITDTINSVFFLLPTSGVNSTTVFKVYETNQYNINASLTYSNISQNDITENAIVSDMDYYRIGSLNNKSFDITKLVKKNLKQGNSTVNFRIWNNSTDDFKVYNPRLIDGVIISGSLCTLKSTPGYYQKDSDNIGNAGNGEIDLKTNELIFTLPNFQTSSKLVPITFTGCYAYNRFGHLGRDFIANYEYEIEIDPNRVILINYKGDETCFISMLKADIKNNHKVTIPENIENAYVNINDQSYFYIESSINNIYKIVYQNGIVVTIALNKITYIKVNELDWIKYNWNGSLLTSITNSDNEVVEVDIYNGRIRTLFFIKQKKKVSFAYQTISGYAYLNYVRLYNYEESKQYLISESKFERTTSGLTRLNKVLDMTKNITMDYKYKTTINDNSIEIEKAIFKDGLTSYKTYEFSSIENKTTITDHFGKIINIYFDNDDQIKIIQNDKRYITYQHQRNNKGELTSAKTVVESNSQNVLTNGDFGEVSGTKPRFWVTSNLTSSDVIEANSFMPDILGGNIFKISGFTGANPIGTYKEIYQTQTISGSEGDEWVFSVWVKAYFTVNSLFRVTISFIYPSYEDSDNYIFRFNSNEDDWQTLTGSAVAEHNYSAMKITITYYGNNPVYLNNIKMYKATSNNYYEYNESGDVNGIKLGTNSYTYTYNDMNNVKEIKSSSGEIICVDYNQRQQMTTLAASTNPQKIEYIYDSKGNNIETNKKTVDRKTSQTSAQYDNDCKLIEETDERGFQKTYRYDDYLRPIESQISCGISNINSYNNNDELISSISLLNNREDGCTYEYDNNSNIKKITTRNNMVYEFEYDSCKRLTIISLNGYKLQVNSYEKLINNQQTDLITSKKYGDRLSDNYSFTYDNEQKLKEVYYYNTPLFTFHYNYDNHIDILEDHLNNIVKTYEYNLNGGLEKIIVNQNNTEKEKYYYHYDNLNNVQKYVQQLDGFKRTFDYDYTYEYDDYSLEGYFTRLGMSFLYDYCRANPSASTIYGKEATLKSFDCDYDLKIKQNVMVFSKEKSCILFNTSDINSERIDQKLYGDKIFDKYLWDLDFENCKTIFAWIKFDSASIGTKSIFCLGKDSTTYTPYLSIKATGTIGNNTSLILYKGSSIEAQYTVPLKLNEWMLIGLKITKNLISVFVDDTINETSTLSSDLNEVTKISIGTYPSLGTSQESLDARPGDTLSTWMHVLYASIGNVNITRDTYLKIYEEGIKYINGYKLQKSNNVRYYNPAVYKDMDVITLNGTLVSSKGLKPKEYCYTAKSYSFNKTKLFEYDDSLKRHVYSSYYDYINYTDRRKSLLSYNLGLWATGTITIWVKPVMKNSSGNKYIISSKYGNTNRASLYIDYSNAALYLQLGTTVIPCGLSLNKDKWNMVAIRWQSGQTNIKVNNSIFKVINDYQAITNCTTYIGCTMENDIPVNHLNGNIQMFSYINRYMSNDEINNIYNNGSLIDIKSIYDNNGRLAQKEINIDEKTLSTFYRYYKEDNKFNNMPASEVNYDGNETIYAYDEAGNITHKAIFNESEEIIEAYNYEYDDLKRLKKESKYQNTNTFIYSYSYAYDNSGNIQSKTSLDSNDNIIYKDTYIYTTSIKDRLERIEREQSSTTTIISAMTYDTNNQFFPKTYKKNNISYNLIWEGRRLKSYGSYEYKYNENGIRTSKKSSGYGYDYVVEGSMIIASYADDNNTKRKIYYNYDSSGILIGLHYKNENSTAVDSLSDEYFYERDLTGNINKIIDKDGKTMVKYTYTAFGIPSSEIGNNLSSNEIIIANILKNYNIYLYKGYCYDYETGLYILSSRYYDPETNRYISPCDVSELNPMAISGLNMYIYACNNPAMVNVQTELTARTYGVNAIVSMAASSIGKDINSVINRKIPSWMKNIADSMSDIILGGKYIFATGIHTMFAYPTATRYMFPILGGTWRWLGKGSTSFGELFGACFKQYVAQDARANLGEVAGSIGQTVAVMAILNFGINLYENNWQIDGAMLLDTAIDTAIGVTAYYAAVGTMSLIAAGALVLGCAVPGGIVVVGVIGLSLLFDWAIREITGYKE